jgi:predicted DNA-binding transcriptional regulator AlpA
METTTMVRKAMRLPAVRAAFGGVGASTVYDWVAKGLLPKPTRIDPASRNSFWWEDEIEAIQKAAERQRTSPVEPGFLAPLRDSARRRRRTNAAAPVDPSAPPIPPKEAKREPAARPRLPLT